MLRLRVSMATVLISFVFAVSSDTMAFTLRFAPDNSTTPTFAAHMQATPDIPTPQFFRILLEQDTLTLILEAAFVQPPLPIPRLGEVPVPLPQPVPPASPSSADLPRYLSGEEMRLLRNTRTVVDQSNP